MSVTTHATKEVLRWAVKSRSKRLHKKLTKRLGPQVVRVPSAYMTKLGLVVHPDVWAEMKTIMVVGEYKPKGLFL